jgi:hypothetical protein
VRRQAVELAGEAQERRCGHPAGEPGYVRQESDLRPHADAVGGRVAAEDADVTGCGPGQAGEDAQRCRLAGAVRPQEAEDRAFGDRQVEAVEGALPAELLDEAVQLDGRRVCAHSRGCSCP